MAYTLFVITVILLILAAERSIVTTITRKPACQSFIRRHPILHPNGISLIRIPQGVVSILFAANGYWTFAIIWFSFWMITDLTDGTIARTCDLKTETGEWLDPLSDKFMSFPALFYLSLGSSPNVISPKLPILWVCIYCVIDVIGQFSRLFCKKKAANSFGKVKTALITVLIAVLALNQLKILPLTFFNEKFVEIMMIACVIMAGLSLYCKVIPNTWYANTLTFLNFCCGVGAIWMAWHTEWRHNYLLAFVMIFAGQFFDLFDGRMARKYGSTKFGALFDDIADFTSFGCAVGSMIYQGLTYDQGRIPMPLAVATAIFYIVCLFYRLYRFLKPTKILPEGIFQGLPSPAGALVAGTTVLAADQFSMPAISYCAAVIVIATSVLMISNVPYRHFGRDLWPSLPKQFQAFILILAIVFCCIALVQREYAKTFTCFFAILGILYVVGARASQKHIQRLQEAQNADN